MWMLSLSFPRVFQRFVIRIIHCGVCISHPALHPKQSSASAFMGSQTILSPSVSGNSGPAQAPALSSLARQLSIYSVTLEELQNAKKKPGKNFGSMNMDDFLENIWTAEESQAMVSTMASGPPSAGEARSETLDTPPSLQRQSNLSGPPTLSRHNVDEVWNEIHEKRESISADKKQFRQGTVGEMTLEDFLVRAGVVKEDADAAQVADVNGSVPIYPPISGGEISNLHQSRLETMAAQNLQADWMNYASRQQQQQLLLQQAEAAAALVASKRGGSLMLAGNLMYDRLPNGAGFGPGSLASGLALSPAVSQFSMHGKKRVAAEVVVEKTMERRQRRMIKNRESAARSRARKQAYTVELEAEVMQLKEENARLQKQQDLQCNIPDVRHLQSPSIRILRRTQSW